MKNGFTLIEVLVTTVIIGIFIVICIPCLNSMNKYFNNINITQIKVLNKINFYSKIDAVNEQTNIIYYSIEDELKIFINEHKIKISEENYLYFDNINYDITVEDIQIKKEYILINIVINDKEQCIILKGEVYEISSS
ncbi:MAG: prepilin-type N-terminal cleavage/methylation domain-containing protein [Bacilli bacterium]|nr:prepilin-type N-terminal cleavage/methylation domain-containing protein [Bacilli bacterium]